jgi:hypothetical protein
MDVRFPNLFRDFRARQASRLRQTRAAGGRYPDYPADGLSQASKRWPA